MMKKLCLALFGMLSLLFISCDRDNFNEHIEGKWSDNIKLSQKTANFDSASNTVTITTEGEGWWLDGIALDKVRVDLGNFNGLSKSFIITKPEFQLERKDSKTIIITMNKNTSNAERVLSISLQNGDYFDQIVVTQSK